ncbi:MAG: signal peptide peptidase SppA, partial [Planctomycetota bacterium]
MLRLSFSNLYTTARSGRIGWRAVTAIAMLACSGCFPSGLLITPVSTRRNLVESEVGRDPGWARDKIVVVDVSGLLMNARKPQFLSDGEHPVSLFTEQLDKARKDSAVKAVILRINSPGGTVTASDLMYDEIKNFQRETGKPVIALMMDVAASGGYYVACACDEIVAQPMTITGSIGVIMQMFDVSGTLNLVGVKTDAITSGPNKDAGSPLRTMTAPERELFQAIVNQMYDRFVQVVVAGRPKLDEASVRKLADGRVYLAGQALETGLVDRIATMRETVEATKRRIGADRIRLVTYHRPLDYRPNYYASAPPTTGGDINWIKLQAPSILPNDSPQFLFLWRP